jgi:siroheme synthase-like protein
MAYYPVYLDLRFRLTLVVANEASLEAAEAKVRDLLAAQGCVRLVSSRATPTLAAWAAEGKIEYRARSFEAADVEGASLVISVLPPDSEEVNQRIWEEALKRRIPVNIMDDVPRCTFIAPSLLRRGDLTVAISTSGSAPALAVRLRQRLEEELGQEHAQFLDLARSVRTPLAAQTPSFTERKERWYRLVDSDVLDLLRQGDLPAARQRFTDILGVTPAAEVG